MPGSMRKVLCTVRENGNILASILVKIGHESLCYVSIYSEINQSQ
jgi:hypothetical protein